MSRPRYRFHVPSENNEATILLEVSIESDRLLQVQAFHHHEAQRVAQRVILVRLPPEQRDGAPFVARSNALDSEIRAPHAVKELNAMAPAIAQSCDEQGMSFDDDRVGRHQTPPLRIRFREQCASTLMGPVFQAQQSKECAGVDEYASHLAS